MNRKFRKAFFHLKLNRYQKEEQVENPKYIQLEHTVSCNLNCITCSRDQVIGNYKKMNLSLEEIDKILSFFPELKAIKLQGLGEPLLHPQIEQIMQRFKEKNLYLLMISNGTLFLSERFRHLATDYVSDIAVSFDSIDSDNFNYLRKGADMDKVIEGIKLLVKDRDERKSKMSIGINFVISHMNYRELPGLYNLVLNLGVDYVTLTDVENWMIPGEEGFKESALFAAESRKYAAKVKKEIRKLQLKFLLKGILVGYKGDNRRLGNCHWPFRSTFVTVEGFVNPCCIRMHKEHAFGNIFEKDFEEIWNSKEYQEFRKSHITKDRLNMMCGNCPN